MNTAEWLDSFDRERRRNPPTLGTYEVERTPMVARLIVGPRSFVLWSRIGAADRPAVVEQEKQWARAHGRSITWKLYSHDAGPGLGPVLRAAGFERRPPETLLLFDLAADLPVGPAPPGVRVEPVENDAQYRDYLAVDRSAFGVVAGAPEPPVSVRPRDPRLGLFVAYAEDEPASIGRVEYEAGQALAGLFGGGTSPAYRGRGIYRELVRTRLEWARRRGARGAFTEAVDTTSRPILERLGFVAVAHVESWRWGVPGAGAVAPRPADPA